MCPCTVTVVGLRYLCVDDGTYGKCKQLEKMKFEGTHNELSAEDVLVLLENLPDLHTIDLCVNTSPVFNAVLLYARKHPGSQPLKEAKGNFYVWSKMKLADWKLFCSVMPNIKKFSVNDFEFPILRLRHLKSIEKLRIVDFGVDLSYPTNFQYNSSLTTLDVYMPDTRVDVSIIAEFCPNLINFRLDVINTDTNKYSFEGKLTKVEEFRTLMTCPDACIHAVMFSKHLRKALLTSLMMNSPDLFEPVLTRAEQDRQILAQLSTLQLSSGRCVSMDILKRFVCLSPRLTVLSTRISREKEKEFKNFLVENQLDHGLTLVLHETLH